MRDTYRPNRVQLSAVLNSLSPTGLENNNLNSSISGASKSAMSKKPEYSLPPPEAAIRARNLVYMANEGATKSVVLNGLTLSVPAGCIYGLLGPSGCGKTTLLRIITGCVRPSGGTIRVFGHEPGRPGSGVPGPGVGYMPQELALHDDLSIEEMLMYFGRLFNLARSVLRVRISHMANVLEFPDTKRLIGTLSGGQKRRVSFAAALIHKPRLVILDEPTVGVDPILRERIWQSLVTATERDKMTVVVTTHYIEEARRAHVVAFMRRGRILAEDSPHALCNFYSATGLEQVFYKLCLAQKRHSELWKRTVPRKKGGVVPLEYRTRSSSLPPSATLELEESYIPSAELDEPIGKAATSWLVKYETVTRKILMQSCRQRTLIFAQFILPFASLVLFCVCVGHTPKGILLIVVNSEKPPQLSDFYLKSINEDIITLVHMDDLERALQDVRETRAWGCLAIGKNFTEALIRRANFASEEEQLANSTIEDSTLRVHADLTNRILSITMERTLEEAVKVFLEGLAQEMGLNPKLFQYPIVIGDVIYGRNSTGGDYFAVRDYGIPGLLVILTYSCAFGLTVLVLTGERADHMFERNFVAGVTPAHIILSHLTSRLLFMTVNVVCLFLVSLHLFDVPQRGSFMLATGLLVLQAIAGLTHGMLVSALCSNFFMSMVLSNFVLLFMFIISGVLWPVESLPMWLRWFSYVQPTTLPTESLRSILSRGLGLDSYAVSQGYLVSFAWIIVFFIGSLFVFRHHR